MSKIFYNIALALPLLAIAACTQRPAPIAMKGSQVYSRGSSNSNSYGNSNSNSYDNSQPASVSVIDEGTQSNAAVGSIGISDLAPPPSAKSGAAASKAPAAVEKIVGNSEPMTSTPLNTTVSTPANSVLGSQPTNLSKPTAVKKRTTVQTVNPWTNAPRDINEK